MDCGIYEAFQKLVVVMNVVCISNELYVVKLVFHTFRNIISMSE